MKSILSKTRTAKPSTPASSPQGSAAGDPEKPAPKFTPRGGSSKNRILVAVKDERIDFQAMSPDAAKTFNELMHSPDVQAQFGIGPLTQGFDPQHCKRIYEALGLVLMGFGKMAFRWPAEALQKLQYTEEEKTELSKPTAAALDELAPKWLRENQAIAALVLVFTAMTQNKIREAAMVAAQMKAAAGGGGKPAANANAAEHGNRVPIPINTPPEYDPGKVNGSAAHVPTAPTGIGPTYGGASPRGL